MKLKDWVDSHADFFTRRDLAFLLDGCPQRNGSLSPSGDDPLSTVQLRYLNGCLREYGKGVPLAYLLEKEMFFGRSFFVREGIFIPRPETEILTERALNLLAPKRRLSVLDLCCGSSCIGITIGLETGHAHTICCADINEDALAGSSFNRSRYRSEVFLVRSDLFSAFSESTFDLIIVNPPYVESACIKGTLLYEPHRALDGGKDGLDYIREIIKHAQYYLKTGGYLIMEMGYLHKKPVLALAEKEHSYFLVECIQDYSGLDRGVIFKKK